MPHLTTTVTGSVSFETPVGVKINHDGSDYSYTIDVTARSEEEAKTALLTTLERIETALGFDKAAPWIDLRKGHKVTIRSRDIEQLFEVVVVSGDGTFILREVEVK